MHTRAYSSRWLLPTSSARPEHPFPTHEKQSLHKVRGKCVCTVSAFATSAALAERLILQTRSVSASRLKGTMLRATPVTLRGPSTKHLFWSTMSTITQSLPASGPKLTRHTRPTSTYREKSWAGWAAAWAGGSQAKRKERRAEETGGLA